MMLAARLERVARETACLHARLEEQAGALRACQSERTRLEGELATLRARLDALSGEPEAIATIPEPETLAPARSGGLLQRFQRGRKTDDIAPEPLAPKDEPPAPTEIAPGPAIVARRFAPQEFLSRLPDLDDAQLDLLHFGVAQLDDEGAVVALNRRESDCTGVSRSDALDRAYFREVLATADGRKLHRTLARGAESGKLDLPLLTNLNEGKETVRAIVHLYRHAPSGTNWALVRRESDGK